jgi:chromosome partitioning protein
MNVIVFASRKGGSGKSMLTAHVGALASKRVTESREVISRLEIPVWAGQITNPADYGYALGSGQGVTEFDPRSQAAAEITSLWSAIDRSVKAIHGVYRSAGAMHRVAA